MRIRVVFLGGPPRGIETNGGHIELEIQDGSDVGAIRQRLGIDYAWTAAIGKRVALDAEMLTDGAELAFVGPMEGGSR